MVAVTRRDSANGGRRDCVRTRAFSDRDCDPTDAHGILSSKVGRSVVVEGHFLGGILEFVLCLVSLFLPAGQSLLRTENARPVRSGSVSNGISYFRRW